MKIKGYVRPDGCVGIRNQVLILPSVVCSSITCEQIAEKVEGAVTLSNQAGCAQVGDDIKQTTRTLSGFGLNGNIAAVLVVGLGCEGVSPKGLAKLIAKSGKPVETLVIQEAGGTLKTVEQGVKIAKRLKEYADSIPLQDVDLKDLTIGIVNDATNVIPSASAIGKFSDLVIEQGGSVIISDPQKLREIENSEVKGILNYGEAPEQKGRFLMQTTDSEVEAITGMVAAGVQLIVHTTNQGSPIGSPVSPVIKVCGDPKIASVMDDIIDINSGNVNEGSETVDDVGKRIFDEVVNVSIGKETKAEKLGFQDFAINRILPSF